MKSRFEIQTVTYAKNGAIQWQNMNKTTDCFVFLERMSWIAKSLEQDTFAENRDRESIETAKVKVSSQPEWCKWYTVYTMKLEKILIYFEC